LASATTSPDTSTKPQIAAPDVSTKPKISVSSDGQKELAYPVTPKQEVAPVTTTSDRQQHIADEPPDTSSATETLKSEVSEPSNRDESLTPLLAEIKTEDLSEQEPPVKPTKSEDLTVEQLPLSDATETVPAETLSPATAVSEDKVGEVAARGGKPLISPPETLDFSEIIAKSNVEIKRLGWTNEQGKQYLLQTYGKRSRQLLSDEELLEFLHYLESQPTP
jgi:hypothetical protein